MATEHTAQAVELYRRIESALATLRIKLDSERLQVADDLTITTLECVTAKLEGTEDAWDEAQELADRERETQADIVHGGCQ